MRIQLLGGCRVTWQGEPLVLPRRRVRALLYRLAAQLQPLPRDRLAFLFWPDAPDHMARRHMTRLLSSLRAALPTPRLVLVDEEMVALAAALVEVDCHAFVRGTAAPDLAGLAEALALYRGPFMDGFALPDAPEYELWQAATAREFHARYLGGLEVATERAVALGDLTAAIQFTQRYLAGDELAEPMHRRLIELFMAVGDRAAAWRQFELCCRVLERELGVGPLPSTRAVLQPGAQRSRLDAPPDGVSLPPTQTLSGQQSLFDTVSIVPILPSLEVPLVGRTEELGRLQVAYARFMMEQPQRGGFMLISGESGMGKSRLMRDYVARQAGLVLTGICHIDGQHMPYAVLIQMLRQTLHTPALWQTVPAHWRSELLPLLPELRQHFPDLPLPIGVATAFAQQHLYTALTEVLGTFAAQQPLLLCFDDLPFADEATLGWLRSLVTNWGATPLVVVATATTVTPRLDQLRKRLRRAGRLAEVDVGPLDITATQQLLGSLSPPPPVALVPQIHQETGGNPFFMLEIVRALQERTQPHPSPATLPLPVTVREAILARISHLSDLAREVLEAAVILDPHLDERLLATVAARSAAAIGEGLEELTTHQVLGIHTADATVARLAFAHPLLRSAVLEQLSPWRRMVLHRRAGQAFAQAYPDQPALVAPHFAKAGLGEAALSAYQQAAAQASALYAYGVALTNLEAACGLLPQIKQPTTRHLTLLRQRLALHRTLLHLEAWASDAAQVLAMAHELGESGAQLEALEAQMSLAVLQGRAAEVDVTATEALALATATGDQVAAARLHQTLGWHLADALGRSREGLTHLQTACRLAEAAEATSVLYQALCHCAFAQRAEGQCNEALASAQRALALTPYQPHCPPHPAWADALRELGEANAYLAHWEAARSYLRPLLPLYRTLDDPWAYGALLYNYGLYSSNMGQHSDAIAAMRQLVVLSERVGLPADSAYGIWHRAGLARVLIAAGEHDEADAVLRHLHPTDLTSGRPYLAWARAWAEYDLATTATSDTLARLMPAIAWWREHASPHDADILILLAQVALATGDRTLAEAALNEATAHLAKTDLERYSLRLLIVQYQISGTLHDRDAARQALQRQAARFTDSALREAFVREVALRTLIRSAH
ncbi:AAA family ATPase [Candidatus Chloroploca sp. Khr17]|uniref:ATP-binding protein n=1 Tax=Candidatus Chloroploca sp. Khr17 TaxID=2496869 RepID=UPI00101DF768|nr:AAA family ATPase [Candidatus Chloroploca sp. Khr17]